MLPHPRHDNESGVSPARGGPELPHRGEAVLPPPFLKPAVKVMVTNRWDVGTYCGGGCASRRRRPGHLRATGQTSTAWDAPSGRPILLAENARSSVNFCAAKTGDRDHRPHRG